jgi:hypothetical protein
VMDMELDMYAEFDARGNVREADASVLPTN